MALNSTSWAYPSTVTGTGWAATAVDLPTAVGTNNDANYAGHVGDATNYLYCSDWITAPATPIALPPGATPVGLELQVQGYNDGAGILTGQTDISAEWGKTLASFISDLKLGDRAAADIGDAPISTGLITYGGQSELWGAGWTDVEAEAACLRLRGATSSPLRGRYIDMVRMRWWYTDGAVVGPGGLLAGDVLKYSPAVSVRASGFGVRK